MAIGAVHREAFRLLTEGILGLSGIEDFSGSADKLVIPRKTLFLGQNG